ncbi:hypothetical protein JYU34_005725 [Plutella xylostella]|uniref:Cytidyltransferase-like domain-containing protein n=1 Tax=Plutella xylostella TaxID=51655 RepID=A0ABQ7QTY4_PLUXY|nr:hypothetical protein JYU34_005725 [Plutella xylostella]
MFNIGRLSIAVVLFSVALSYVTLYLMNATKSVTTMANYGLLFVSNVSKVNNFFLKSSNYVRKVLYINVNSSDCGAISQQIVNVYSKVTSQCNNLDVRLILKPFDNIKKINTAHSIDLILYDNSLAKEVDRLKESVVSLQSGYNVQSIDLKDEQTPETATETVKTYEYVVLGGTFDRLHNGHKILLSQAALRTTKLLTVGVTDVNMIKSKKLWELIEPVETRIKSVLEFLTDINPTIEYNVLPIQDMYGPTKDDPRFQLIVLSEETDRAGDKVNEARREGGLPALDKYLVRLAGDARAAGEEEAKLSSSNQRMRLLGTTLRAPEPNPNIPKWPYVIGLAGGIAAGKSGIAERLRAKGAAVINCDVIAHELYRPGLPLNTTIAETFGGDVITSDGEVDRRKLGQIVFADSSQLHKLNSLVWPAVIAEASRRAAAAGAGGARVAVLEAAVLLQAGWGKHCHQLWTAIVPPDEAVKRIMARNGLPEEEARQRVLSQPSNQEQVAAAHVVFSPYWSPEHTQRQVDRAWDDLQELLKNRGE